MIPLIVLFISLLVFRGLGVLGIPLFLTWHDSTTWALSVMVLFTASAHFTSLKEDFIKMVPKPFPYPRQIVFVTGLLEILGAIGLLIPQVRTAAGICLSHLVRRHVSGKHQRGTGAGSPAWQVGNTPLAAPPNASALHRSGSVGRSGVREEVNDATQSRNARLDPGGKNVEAASLLM